MFVDIENFKKYVGPKSGTNYVWGLRSIENIFGEDIESEYMRDRCEALLSRINERKNDNTLSVKEKKRASDIHSHLKKYVEFRDVQRGTSMVEFEQRDMSGDSDNEKTKEFDKNIILYGPPGTGKTYNTVVYAVAIIEKDKTLEEVAAEAKENYAKVYQRYEQYISKGLVHFTTFHQ